MPKFFEIHLKDVLPKLIAYVACKYIYILSISEDILNIFFSLNVVSHCLLAFLLAMNEYIISSIGACRQRSNLMLMSHHFYPVFEHKKPVINSLFYVYLKAYPTDKIQIFV